MSRSQEIFELTNDSKIIKLFHDTLDEEKKAAIRRLSLMEEALKDAMRRAEHAESELSGRLTEKEMRSLRMQCVKVSADIMVAGRHTGSTIAAMSDDLLKYVLLVETQAHDEPKMTSETGFIPPSG